jgi:hypothetical protein
MKIADRVENETGVHLSVKEAASLKKRKGESEIEWYVLVAMPPLKTGSHCGDTKAKIAAQLVHDEIGIAYSSCYQYAGKWCREASSNESKSKLIEHGGKSWQLRIIRSQ